MYNVFSLSRRWLKVGETKDKCNNAIDLWSTAIVLYGATMSILNAMYKQPTECAPNKHLAKFTSKIESSPLKTSPWTALSLAASSTRTFVEPAWKQEIFPATYILYGYSSKEKVFAMNEELMCQRKSRIN